MIVSNEASRASPVHFQRDGVGNVLRGIRAPDVDAGRGLFLARPPGVPPGSAPSLVGAHVDRSETFANRGASFNAFKRQADALLDERLLLPTDHALLLEEAAQAAIGASRSSKK